MRDLIFHHVGIACSSIAAEEEYYSTLGYTREGREFVDPAQKIRGIFMTLGPFRIELLEPASKNSPLDPFLQKGVQMYHQAFLCDRLGETIDFLAAQGAVLLVPPVPAVAFNGRKISFLMLRNRMMVELIESVP
jgi:methylmalonyl-CoA/ethylmalonyl-CoA epimerase